MDVKNLRTETALSESNNNDGSKYNQGGIALQCNRNKSYQDIGSNPLAKTEPTPVRPCAVIGPDRVLPPPGSNDAFLKKGSDPWPSLDSVYRRPPEYPHKILNNQNPSRNISPRQTFQENMPRIMVPPTYNAVRHSDDANLSHIQDRNVAIPKSVKPNMAPEGKFCDVPYAVNSLTNEPKNVRDPEMFVPSVNSTLTRTAPHGWPPGSANVHPSRTYGAHELYQYQQYPSCAGQRPSVIPMTRPHRTIHEEAYAFPDHYYQDASARFKRYPPVKEQLQQPRYEYGNYPSQFHPPSALQPHRYDISKSGQPHPYSMYPHLKYLDNRVPDHTMEAYQRATNQQPPYNIQFRNQVIQPTYAPVPGNSSQNKVHPYPPDGSVKSMAPNKLLYDSSSKIYTNYENSRNKTYPMADNYFVNEMSRVHSTKNQIMPNYSPIGMHSIPTQQYFRKDNSQMKTFEYLPHFRHFEPPMNNNAMMRHAPLFSPNTLDISPTESSTNIDTSQTHGTSQEDCGYVSQSSTASARSVESGIYRLPHEYYKRYDFSYGPIVGSSPLHTLNKPDLNSNSGNSKDKQKIDVRQYLQMWNEGEEENAENNNSKEIVIQTGSSGKNSYPKHVTNQDQLYVLGLVNVPSEELGKYEHIQKISKLPENIKGYNNLELLSQFEEAIESSNTNVFKSIPREYQKPSKDNLSRQLFETLPRAVSPLDVEAKISQSIIHKEVGCNFEIRPCSPKMLNVGVAAPAQNVLGERVIEKVTNPLSKTVKSPISIKPDENSSCHTIKRQENSFAIGDNPSCKMISSPYASNMDSVKTNYSLQDLEINSGLCYESLPRLDNEIELNFPEVNQQFINANKKDDNSRTNSCSRTNMVVDSGLSKNKLVKIGIEKGENSIVTDESEKTSTKLSKYRKFKINPINHSEKNQVATAVRTDSVIIKNPENIKNIEDKLLENSLNVPMNLSSQSSVCYDLTGNINENNHDADIALDFSLNKSGNDLPIIVSEKDELIKSLATNHLLLSSNSRKNPSEHRNKKYNSNKNIKLNKKKLKTLKSEHNKDICIGFNKEATMEVEANFVQTINPVDVKNTHSSDLDNACTDSLISENAAPINQFLNHDTDLVNTNNVTEISESVQTCTDREICGSEGQAWDKKYGKHGDTTTSNDNTHNEENSAQECTNPCNLVLPHTEIVSKYDESGQIMQLFSPENEVKSLVDRNEVCKNELISSQNKKDFEHDEISARLEKLFQESNDDTELLGRDNGSLGMSVSSPMKNLSCHQSKELYSPWIQKLLTHSEGLCSNSSTQKDQIQYFPKDDQYVDKPEQTNTDVSEVEESQNMEIEHKVTGSLHYTKNRKCKKKMSEDLSSDAESKTEHKSNTIKHIKSDTVTVTVEDTIVCIDNNENKPQEVSLPPEITDMTNEPQLCLEKSSNDIMTNENYGTNHELDVSTVELTKKSNLKNCDQDTLQDSTFVKELENDKAVVNLCVDSIDNEIEMACRKPNNIVQEEAPPICIRRKGVSESENIIQGNWTKNSENLTSFISTNSTIHETEKYQSGETLIQNMTWNSDTAPGKFDCSKIVSKLDNANQEVLIKPSLEEHKDKECSIEEVIQNRDSNLFETLEIFKSNNVVCKNDNVAQKRLNNPHLESLSNDVSGICIGHQTKEMQSGECLLKTCDIDADDTLGKFDSNNVAQKELNNPYLESLSNSVFDIGTGHQTKENQNGECLINHCNTDAEEPLETLDSNNVACKMYNMAQKELNNPRLESLSNNVSDICTGHQTKDLQNGECLKIPCDTDADETLGTLESNNVVCKNDNIDQEKCNKTNIESLSTSACDICTGHQTKENQNGECLINPCNADADEPLETLDSSHVSCKMYNMSQKKLHNPHLESLSNNVSDICTGHQTKELQNGECLIKPFDTEADETLRTLESNNVVCKNNNTAQEKINKTNIESLSTSASDICTGHGTEENVNGECLLEGVINNEDSFTVEISETFDADNIICKNDNDIFQRESHIPHLDSLSNSDSNNFTGHQTSVTTVDSSNIFRNLDNKTQKDLNSPCPTIFPLGISDSTDTTEEYQNRCNLMENFTKNWNKDTADTAKTTEGKIYNISGFDLNDPNVEKLTNSAFDNCTGNQLQNNHSEENTLENNNILTDTNSNTVVLSTVDDSKNNHKPEILIQENHSNSVLKNVANCVSDKWSEQQNEVNSPLKNLPKCVKNKLTEHQKEGNSPLVTTSIVADDKVTVQVVPVEQRDKNLKNKCNQDVENDQGQLDDEKKASNSNKQEITMHDSPVKLRLPLKRSFSDSALDSYKKKDNGDRQLMEHTPLIWPSKRQRMYEIEHSEQHVLDENLCNLIHSNRRNSVSSFYNEENVSFCILIDNDCIITEENEEEKICFAELSQDCVTEINTTNEEDDVGEDIGCSQDNQLDFSESVILDYENEKSWLDDVACVETVVSDDIVDDIVMRTQFSPRHVELSEYDDSGIYNCDISELKDKVESMNEHTLSKDVSEIVETHHIDVNTKSCHDLYTGECSENIISESNSKECTPSNHIGSILLPDDTTNEKTPEDKENLFLAHTLMQSYENCPVLNSPNIRNNENDFNENISQTRTSCSIIHDDGVDSHESSIDNVFSFEEHDEDINYTTSSSPEVSSTTSEEKSSCILLKITNYNGSRVSEVNEVNHNRPRCKFTEKKEYSNSYGGFPNRPLITKAAQKYIPPIKESIGDLKVKLSLPQQKLQKLKQLKLSKNEPKVNKKSNAILIIPKKPKPNFEDVLKSIDEVQIKMHKEKSKKVKNIVPKVVIKKNFNGAHYTSSNKETFNPDLTGRKWQPWVFLEKSHFIDKMAISNNKKAIFSHRKNTYVLAENLKKYRSVSNCSAKFVITQPRSSGSSKGQLKYTIRLKHTY